MGGEPSTPRSLKVALSSWRLGSLTLLSLSSGMPLGLVITAVPAWLAMAKVDIKTIGVLSLAQAPYAFKFLWSPLMDRFRLPWLGARRGWVLLTQLALAAATSALAAAAAGQPEVGWVAGLTLLIAVASASQDIALDGYAVEVLKPEEHGVAVGARTAMYRAGMWVAGNIAISVAPLFGWDVTIALLGTIYLALLPVTVLAPEPAAPPPRPTSLRAAVWEPFVGFFLQHRALEIAAFLVLYKLADNLAQALVRPFLLQLGFAPWDVGVASGTVGLFATLAGTFLGGVLTQRLGVARALWLFGFLQAVSNLGYALVAQVGVNRPLMFAAIAVEAGTTGMGSGAFGVLLLRLTQKRFSTTQFALFSSIFALGRTLSGPPAGAIADAIGWRDFFVVSMVAALPGLILLQRFAPWGTREIAEPKLAPPLPRAKALSTAALVRAGLLATGASAFLGLVGNATLTALKGARGGQPFDLRTPLSASLTPQQPSECLELASALAFGLVVGFGVAAYLAARRGSLPSAEQSP